MHSFSDALAVATGFLAAFGMTVVAPAPDQTDLPLPLPIPPRISIDDSYTAQSALIADLGGSWRTAERSTDKRRAIASITKVMTGFLALETLSEGTPIVFSQKAAETSGEAGDFRAGEVFALRDALYALMLSSSNGMATAIAETVGERLGGRTFDEKIERFVALMNKKAYQLGMHDTLYRNPTGIDVADGEPSNFSSVNDLLKLVQASMKTPILWEPSRERRKIIASFGHHKHGLINKNTLTSHIINFVGSKTGTTKASGESVIIIYEIFLGRPQVLILLGADSNRRIDEASSLLLRTGGMLL